MNKQLRLNISLFVLGIFTASSILAIPTENTITSNRLNSPTEYTPTPILCARDNRYIETSDAPDEEIIKSVFDNKKVFDFIKDNCLWVFGSTKASIIDKDSEQIIFWGAPIGCGSCHAHTLYIFSSEGNLLTNEKFTDISVGIVKNYNKPDYLTITTPLRSSHEPMSSPSWGIKTTYEWDKYTKSLRSLSTVPIQF